LIRAQRDAIERQQQQQQWDAQVQTKQAADAKASAASTLPKCDSNSVRNALIGAVEQSPAGKTTGLALLSIVQPTEIAFDSNSEIRNCKGTGFFNNGKYTISYNIEWVNRNGGTYYVSITDAR
jgi:hypothetical protein